MNEKPSFLDFNKDRRIVPPMENKVGGTYAETRAEIEARKRAEEEARRQLQYQEEMTRQAELAAQQARMNQPKKNTGLVAVAVLMGVLALVGLGVAGYLFLNKTEQDKKLATQESELSAAQQKVAELEEEIENNSGKGFIYLEEFGIKIKVKDTLEKISYVYDDNFNYRPTICFNAVSAGTVTSPGFANVRLNPGGMGCLMRVAIEEGDNDAENGKSFGEKVLSVGKYNYFYVAPQAVFATDEAEKGLEVAAVQALKLMLTDKNGVSEY